MLSRVALGTCRAGGSNLFSVAKAPLPRPSLYQQQIARGFRLVIVTLKYKLFILLDIGNFAFVLDN